VEGRERGAEGVMEGGGCVIGGGWRVEVRGRGEGESEEGEDGGEEGMPMSTSHAFEGERESVTVDGRSIGGEGGTTSRVMGERVRMV
jgi:hypothetical protein